MRDLIAGVVAVVLLLVAASLATTLRLYRRQRARNRDAERALGRTIIAEIPAEDALVLFSEDGKRFYYGDRSIDKDLIRSVQVLINGSPIATYVAPGQPQGPSPAPSTFEDRPDGILRDRWDVSIDSEVGVTLIPCGAIRERVSQELARAIFDAVKRDLEKRQR